jgi:hypothetical protein
MAVKPEVIGDVEEGEPRLPAETRDEMGLTPDERAQWDEMQDAAKEAGLRKARKRLRGYAPSLNPRSLMLRP